MGRLSFPAGYNEKDSLVPKIKKHGKLLEKNAGNFLKTITYLSPHIEKSFLSTIDTRIKSCAIIGAVILIALARSLVSLIVAVFFSVSLYSFSGNAVRRIYPFLIISLVFFLFIAPVALTEFVTKGEVLFEIYGVGITKEGIVAVLRLFLRSFSILLLVLLITSTTPLSKLIDDIPLPSSLKIILTVMHLNIRKMLFFSYDSYLSRISRSPVVLGAKSHRQYIGLFLARLFKNSLKTSDEIHLALISRGWDKKMPSPGRLKFGLKEIVLTVTFLSFYLMMAFTIK